MNNETKGSRVRKFVAELIYWVFGVVTCTYYAVACVVSLGGQSTLLCNMFGLLFIIPLSNGLLLTFADERIGKSPKLYWLMGSLSGAALLVAVPLSILLLPYSCLDLLAMVAITVFGLPHVFSLNIVDVAWFYSVLVYLFLVANVPLLTANAMRTRLRKLQPQTKQNWLPVGVSCAAMLGVVLCCTLPVSLTETCETASTNAKVLAPSLLLLRAIGDEQTMLRACYNRKIVYPWFFTFASDREDYTDNALSCPRELYYRVTGTPFNSRPHPRTLASKLVDEDINYDYTDFYYSDHDFASDTVGGCVRGLALTNSRIKGWVNPDAGLAHLKWKMHFHNKQYDRAELRAQVQLPPGAVIDGCSLWINGVKHDAVIATRESTRQAYTQAAEKGEKPFMVSTAGTDRVLVQSSLGFWGKDADLMFEITSPLVLQTPEKAALPMPVFAERNFSVPDSHSISVVTISDPATEDAVDAEAPAHASQRLISNDDMLTGKGTLFFSRNPKITGVLSPDRYQPGKNLSESISFAKCPGAPLVVVLDGSSKMSDAMKDICDTLDKVESNNATIVWASDTPITVVEHVATSSPAWKQALSKLRDSSCLGGQNNAEALALVANRYCKDKAINVVWLHGPQPVKFDATPGDQKNIKACKNLSSVKTYEYQVCAGPNEVIRSLALDSVFRHIPRLDTWKSDLEQLFAQVSGKADVCQTSIESISDNHSTTEILKASDTVSLHGLDAKALSRLHTYQLVCANLAPAHRKTFGTMAEKANLVTPITSALVLEQKADYNGYGVKTHSESTPMMQMQTSSSGASGLSGKVLPSMSSALGSATVPSKPEPPMSLVVMCIAAVLTIFRWIKGKRDSASLAKA